MPEEGHQALGILEPPYFDVSAERRVLERISAGWCMQPSRECHLTLIRSETSMREEERIHSQAAVWACLIQSQDSAQLGEKSHLMLREIQTYAVSL